MSMKDSFGRFGNISIVNHWTLALLMIGMLVFGLIIEDMPRSAEKKDLIGLHKSIGVLILFLGTWRVSWRILQKFPTPIEGLLAWELKASKIVHLILLAGILIMPVSGYIMSETAGYSVSFFGLFELPALGKSKPLNDIAHGVHEYFATFLMAVILLHIAAALKHHFIAKDGTLKRMLGR